jgi:hypothetical protein
MAADQYVPVPNNATGLKIDLSELTVNGVTVERPRNVIADPVQPGNLAAVAAMRAHGELQVRSEDQVVLLSEIRGELKRVAMLLELLVGKSVSLTDVN